MTFDDARDDFSRLHRVFTFHLGRIGVASTGLYSIDRSLFRLAAIGATERRLVRSGVAVTLDASGRAVPA